MYLHDTHYIICTLTSEWNNEVTNNKELRVGSKKWYDTAVHTFYSNVETLSHLSL